MDIFKTLEFKNYIRALKDINVDVYCSDGNIKPIEEVGHEIDRMWDLLTRNQQMYVQYVSNELGDKIKEDL